MQETQSTQMLVFVWDRDKLYTRTKHEFWGLVVFTGILQNLVYRWEFTLFLFVFPRDHSLYGKDGFAISPVVQGLSSVSFDVMLVAIATTVIVSS